MITAAAWKDDRRPGLVSDAPTPRYGREAINIPAVPTMFSSVGTSYVTTGSAPAPLTDHDSSAATPRPATRLARDVAIPAIFFAAVTVLLQFAIVLYRRESRGAAEVGWHFAWMLPVTEGLLFALAALPLALLALLLRRRGGLSPAVPAFVFAALGIGTALLVLREFHWWANALLAAGLGARAAQAAGRHPAGVRRMTARGASILGGLVALAALGVPAAKALGERRALAALPEARGDAPNVLFLILDTVRAASLSLYGHTRPTTPELEALARRGVVFDRAIATAPWTLPTHTTLFTGRYTNEVTVGWRTRVRDAEPFLTEVLRARGYRTGGFAANLVYATAERGFARGFIHYEDFVPTLGEFILTSSVGQYVANRRNRIPGREDEGSVLNHKSAGSLHASLLAWIDRTRDERRRRPFFAFVNYADAHVPYLAQPPFLGRWAGPERWTKYSLERNGAGWAGSDQIGGVVLANEQAAYDEAIAYIDHEIGRLLGELDRRGELANTIVVVTADHGEEFKEHGVLMHALSMYLPSIHVPLLIAGPGDLPRGTRVAQPVTLRDVPSTILDLVGAGDGSGLPGHTLARFWRAGEAYAAAPASPILSELRPMPKLGPPTPAARGQIQSLVVEDRWHYIRYGDGTEEVYDIIADPWEKTDLARTPAGQTIVARYRPTLPDLQRTSPGVRDTIVY